MATIHAPNRGYTGVSASVTFCNGVGETTDPHLIRWFREHSYRVEETKDPEGEKDKPAKQSKRKTSGQPDSMEGG